MPRDDACFQCGARPIVMELPDDDAPGAWLTCDRCGERVMTVADFRAQVEQAEEERVKQALGFYEFRPQR